MVQRLAAGIAILALGVVPALARDAWDQTAVNELASELATATRELKAALLQVPRIAEGEQRRDPDVVRLLDTVDALGKSARRLTRALGDTKGYDETLPIVDRIRALVHDARQFLVDPETDASIERRMETVEAVLASLAGYYPTP